MLTEICQELKNWFDVDRRFGTFTISNHVISIASDILEGQYYRIIGSIFNDGIYQRGVDDLLLKDEEFDGAVWLLAIPKQIEEIASEISNWVDKYGEVTTSPYNSESFEGYSYSKGSVSGSSSSTTVPTWKSVFADKLNRWRKL